MDLPVTVEQEVPTIRVNDVHQARILICSAIRVCQRCPVAREFPFNPDKTCEQIIAEDPCGYLKKAGYLIIDDSQE